MPKSFLISRRRGHQDCLEDVLESPKKSARISENCLSGDGNATCIRDRDSSSATPVQFSHGVESLLSGKITDLFSTQNLGQKASDVEKGENSYMCCNKANSDSDVSALRKTNEKASDHFSLHRPEEIEPDLCFQTFRGVHSGRDAKRALSFSDANVQCDGRLRCRIMNHTDENNNEESYDGNRLEETSQRIDRVIEKETSSDLMFLFCPSVITPTSIQGSHFRNCNIHSGGFLTHGHISESNSRSNLKDFSLEPSSTRCVTEELRQGVGMIGRSVPQGDFHSLEHSKSFSSRNMGISQKSFNHPVKSDIHHRCIKEYLPVREKDSIGLSLERSLSVNGELCSSSDPCSFPVPHLTHKMYGTCSNSDSRLSVPSNLDPWMSKCYDKYPPSTGSLKDTIGKESQPPVRLPSVFNAESNARHPDIGNETKELSKHSRNTSACESETEVTPYSDRLPNLPCVSSSHLQIAQWFTPQAMQNSFQIPSHEPHGPVYSLGHPYSQHILPSAFNINSQSTNIGGKHVLEQHGVESLPVPSNDLTPNKDITSVQELTDHGRDSTSPKTVHSDQLHKQTTLMTPLSCDQHPSLNYYKHQSSARQVPESLICTAHQVPEKQNSKCDDYKNGQILSSYCPHTSTVSQRSPRYKKHNKRSRRLKSFTISSIMDEDDLSDNENENSENVTVSSHLMSPVQEECKSTDSPINSALNQRPAIQASGSFEAVRNETSQKDQERHILRPPPRSSPGKELESNSVRTQRNCPASEKSVQHVHPSVLINQSFEVGQEKSSSLIKSESVSTAENEKHLSKNSWAPINGQSNVCDLGLRNVDTSKDRNNFFLAQKVLQTSFRSEVTKPDVHNHPSRKSPSGDSDKDVSFKQHSLSASAPEYRRPPEIQMPHHHLLGKALFQKFPLNHNALRINHGGIYQPVPMRFNPSLLLSHPVVNNSHFPGNINTYPKIPVKTNPIPSPSKTSRRDDVNNYSDKKDIRSPGSDAASVMSSDPRSPTSSSVSSRTSPVCASSISPGQGRLREVTPSANQCLERSYLKLGLDIGKQGPTGKHDYEEGKSFKAFLETASVKLEFINNGNGIKNPLLSTEFADNKLAIMSNSCSLPCPVCNLTFDSAKDLQRHLKGHREIKRFLCTFCGKGFNDTFDLKRHSRTHTGVRPYKCNQCEKAFTQRCSLESHSRKIHGSVESLAFNERRVKLFVCEVCGHSTDMAEEHYTHVRHAHHLSHMKGIVDTANPVAAL